MKYPQRVLALAACLCLTVTELEAQDAVADGNSAVSPDAKQEAEKHFRAGVTLQKAEDFNAAIVAFEASLRLFPTKGALFNLANCLRAAHRYPDALKAFEELKQRFGAELEGSMLAAVNMQIAELENLTGTLELEIEPSGAEIKLDGRPIGSSPLSEPLRLSLGDHELQISEPGFETKAMRVNVAPGQRVLHRIALSPTPPLDPAPPSPRTTAEPANLTAAPRADVFPTEHSRQEHPYRAAALVAGGSGLAFLAAGTASGLWALSINRDLDRACEGSHCPKSRGEDIERLQTLTHATNVLLTIGAVATVSGVVLWLVGEPASSEATVGTDVHVRLAPGVAQAQFVKRF